LEVELLDYCTLINSAANMNTHENNDYYEDDEPFEEPGHDETDDLDEERTDWAYSWTRQDYSGSLTHETPPTHEEYERAADAADAEMDNFDTYEEYSTYIDRVEESRDTHEMKARGM
jgi:hypothetical protein